MGVLGDSPSPQLDVTEFAKRIRAKAGAYDDVDDADLVEKFVRKNPVYADKVKLPEGFKLLHTTSSHSNLDSVYEQAGREHNVDPSLLIEQGRQESIGFKPNVVYGKQKSPKGASGVSQFMPDTARRFGLRVDNTVDERNDPRKAIPAQAKYMRELLDQFDNNEDLALAAYNSGEHRKALREGRVPNIGETQDYVKQITSKLGSSRKVSQGTLRKLLGAPQAQPEVRPPGGPQVADDQPVFNIDAAAEQVAPTVAALQTDPAGRVLLQSAGEVLQQAAAQAIDQGLSPSEQELAGRIQTLGGTSPADQNAPPMAQDLMPAYTKEKKSVEAPEEDLKPPVIPPQKTKEEIQQEYKTWLGDRPETQETVDEFNAIKQSEHEGLKAQIDDYNTKVEEHNRKAEEHNQLATVENAGIGADELVRVGESAKKGDLNVRSKYEQWLTANNKTDSQESIDAFNKEQKSTAVSKSTETSNVPFDSAYFKRLNEELKKEGQPALTKEQFIASQKDTAGVSTSINPSDFKIGDKSINSDEFQSAVTTTDGGEMWRPREIGKGTGELTSKDEEGNIRDTVAGIYRAPAYIKDEATALKQALINVGGVTSEQADIYIAKHKDSLLSTEGWQPGDNIHVRYSTVAEAKGEKATVEDIRSEQAQSRTNPNIGIDLKVGKDWVKEDADWLKETIGEHPAEIVGTILGGGGDTAKAMAGLARFMPVMNLGPKDGTPADLMQNWSDSINESDIRKHTKGEGFVSQVIELGDPSMWARFILLSELPGGYLAAMPIDAGAITAGTKGSRWTDIAKAAGKAEAIGLVFKAAHIPGGVGKYAVGTATENKLAQAIGQKAGETVGVLAGAKAVSQGFSKAFGDKDTSDHDALVAAAFQLYRSFGKSAVGKGVRVRDADGKPLGDITITPEGKVKRLDGFTAEKPDIEMTYVKQLTTDITRGEEGRTEYKESEAGRARQKAEDTAVEGETRRQDLAKSQKIDQAVLDAKIAERQKAEQPEVVTETKPEITETRPVEPVFEKPAPIQENRPYKPEDFDAEMEQGFTPTKTAEKTTGTTLEEATFNTAQQEGEKGFEIVGEKPLESDRVRRQRAEDRADTAERRVREERRNTERAVAEGEKNKVTGMPGTAVFDRAVPDKDKPLPGRDVVLWDLDNFKAWNDIKGHQEGNKLMNVAKDAINQAATELKETRENFHFGGDEFASIPEQSKSDGIIERAQEIFGEHRVGDKIVTLTGAKGDTFNTAEKTLKEQKKNRKIGIAQAAGLTATDREGNPLVGSTVPTIGTRIPPGAPESQTSHKVATPEGRQRHAEQKERTTPQLLLNLSFKNTSKGLEINSATSELTRRLIEARTGRPVPVSDAMFHNPRAARTIANDVRSFADKYRTKLPPSTAKQLDDYARTLSSVGKGGKVTYTFDEAARHERLHKLSYTSAGVKKLTERVKNVASFARQNRKLIEKAHAHHYSKYGYQLPDLKKDNFSPTELGQIATHVEEIAVSSMDGDFASLGLTSREAAEYLREWFVAYREQHGIQALKNFEKFFAGLEEHLPAREAIRSINEKVHETKGPKSRKVVSETSERQQGETDTGDTGVTRTERERATIRSAEEANLVDHMDDRYYTVKHKDDNIRQAQDRIENAGLAQSVYEAVQQAPTNQRAEHTAFQMEVVHLLNRQARQAMEKGDELTSKAKLEAAQTIVATIAQQGTDYGQAISQLSEWQKDGDPDAVTGYVQKRRAQMGYAVPLSPDQLEQLRKAAADVADLRSTVAELQKHIEGIDKRLEGKSTNPRTSKKTNPNIERLQKLRDEIRKRVEENPLLMVAFHGTRHRFDKFDISKLGTGEGAQVYGWGLYFTSKEEIADWYRRNLSGGEHAVTYRGLRRRDLEDQITEEKGNSVKTMALSTLMSRIEGGDSFKQALATQLSVMSPTRNNFLPKEYHERHNKKQLEAREFIESLKESDFDITKPGAKYKVDLKPAEDEYLLWDKPFDEQPPKMQKLIRAYVDDYLGGGYEDFIDAKKHRQEVQKSLEETQATMERLGPTVEHSGSPNYNEWAKSLDKFLQLKTRLKQFDQKGGDFYKDLADMNDSMAYDEWSYRRDEILKEKGPSHPDFLEYLNNKPERGDKITSLSLLEHGIRGVKYATGNTRGKDTPDYNYVIFDDNDIDIIEILAQVSKQPQPIFFSQVERTLEEKMPNKASADQVKGILKDTKKEERDWLGIDQWLQDNPNPTKEQALEFVRANNVNVTEVMSSGQADSKVVSPEAEKAKKDLGDKLNEFLQNYGKELNEQQILQLIFKIWSGAEENDDFEDLFDRVLDQWVDSEAFRNPEHDKYGDEEAFDTYLDSLNVVQAVYERYAGTLYSKSEGDFAPRYKQYTLPGGENYRELLLTLPLRPKVKDPAELPGGYQIEKLGDDPNLIKVATEVFDAGEGYWVVSYPSIGEERGVLGAYPPGLTREQVREKAREDLDITQGEGGGPSVDKLEDTANFNSSHFDTPNILAHIRFDTRTDDKGKKNLHIAEIQSDWMQSGRKRGFAVKELPDKYKVVETAPLDATVERKGTHSFAVWDENNLPVSSPTWNGRAMDKEEVVRKAIEALNFQTVPDAPFKKTWHELAFKRMVRYAVDNGYDSISWDTGATQNERYSLSNHVDFIKWGHSGSTVDVYVTFRNYGGQLSFKVNRKTGVIEESEAGHGEILQKSLDEVVGKELADQMLAEPEGELSGLNLEMGGEGQKGFYDKILPSFVNKYVRKWGAKVEDGKIDREGDLSDYSVMSPNGNVLDTYDTQKEAEEAAREESEASGDDFVVKKNPKKVDTHLVKITDSMKEGAEDSQPLFQISPDQKKDLIDYTALNILDDKPLEATINELKEIAPSLTDEQRAEIHLAAWDMIYPHETTTTKTKRATIRMEHFREIQKTRSKLRTKGPKLSEAQKEFRQGPKATPMQIRIVEVGADEKTDPKVIHAAVALESGEVRDANEAAAFIRDHYPQLTPGEALNTASLGAKFRKSAKEKIAKENAELKAEKEGVQKKLRVEEKKKNVAQRELLNRINALEKPPPTYPQRIARIYKAALVSAVQTSVNNLVTAQGARKIVTLTDLTELAINTALAKAGREVRAEGIQPGTPIRDILGLSTDTDNAVDALKKNFTESVYAQSIANSVLDEFPTIYEELFRSYASDIDVLPERKGAAGVGESLMRGVEFTYDKLNILNKFQEFLLRSQEFNRQLQIRLGGKGLTLKGVIASGRLNQIDPADIRYAVREALRVTFALTPDKNTVFGKFIDLYESKVPALLAPFLITFPRFTYNAGGFIADYTPVIGIIRAGVNAKKPGGSYWDAFKQVNSRDVSRQLIGTLMFLIALGFVRAFGDDDKWYLLKVPGATKDDKPLYVDVRGWQPFAAFVFMANKINRLMSGQPMFSDPDTAITDTVEATLGLSTRNLVDNKLLEAMWHGGKAVTNLGDEKEWERVSYLLQQQMGEIVGGLLRPLKTIKDLVGEFDEWQSSHPDLVDQPVLQGPSRSVPFFNAITGASMKRNYVTGETERDTHPGLKVFGVSLVDGKRHQEPLSPALVRIRELEEDYHPRDILPASQRQGQLKGDFWRALRDAGQDLEKQKIVTDKLDQAVSEGKLREGQASYIERGKGLTELQSHMKSATWDHVIQTANLMSNGEKESVRPIIEKRMQNARVKPNEDEEQKLNGLGFEEQGIKKIPGMKKMKPMKSAFNEK